MPAYFDTGFSVRQPMWHGLGIVPDRNPSSAEEAWEWASEGDPWEPVKVPLFSPTEAVPCSAVVPDDTVGSDDAYRPCPSMSAYEVIDADAGTRLATACPDHVADTSPVSVSRNVDVRPLAMRPDPSHYRLARNDNGHTLAVHPSTWEPFGNVESFRLVEALLDQPNVDFQTGGVLKGGARVWALARVNEPMEVPGDPSPLYPYVSVLNFHDGSGSLKAIRTTIRIVCWNTWSAAEAETDRTGWAYTFAHTKNMRERVEEAREVITGATADAARWVDIGRNLIGIGASEKQEREFIEAFIPTPPDGLASDRVIHNVEQARAQMTAMLASPTCEGIRGTAWGLVQAAGEFLDHGRTWRTRESYVGRTLLSPESGKTKALHLVGDVLDRTDDIERLIHA